MAEVLNFYGQINHAAEHTVYRIYFVQNGFAFIRTGRSEPLQFGGLTGLVQAAISNSVHAVLNNGPASSSESTSTSMQDAQLEQLLGEHRRNFFAPLPKISNVRIRFGLVSALGWKKPEISFWKMSVQERGNVSVLIGGESLKVAVPLLDGLFNGVFSGKWGWDSGQWDFRRR